MGTELELEIQRLEDRLAECHAKTADTITQIRSLQKIRDEFSAEVRRIDARLKILRGEKRGGRPRGALVHGTEAAKVQRILGEDSDRKWTVAEMAEAAGTSRPATATRLRYLAATNRAVRLGRGLYRAIRHGEAGTPRAPKSAHGSLITLMDELAQLFDAEPDRVWTIDHLVSAGHVDSSVRCSRALCDLHRQGRVVRIGRGRYTSVANPAEPRLTRKQRHTMRSRAFKAGGDAVANWG